MRLYAVIFPWEFLAFIKGQNLPIMFLQKTLICKLMKSGEPR